jgi:uncharacterized protein (DUF433 family)
MRVLGEKRKVQPDSFSVMIEPAFASVRCLMKTTQLIERDPEKLGGTPVFFGTRVPIKNLFDYLEAGDSLDVFLDDFPTVTREQALGVIEGHPDN